MEYAAAKIEQDDSDSHGGQDMNVAKTAVKSTAKTSFLDQQERDAEAGQQGIPGEDFRPWETAVSVHSQTNSSARTRFNAFKRRNRALEAKIAAEKEQLKETSERIRTQIMSEFPTIFQEPQELPPTR
jgi:GH15 family glucan-1,4-alpha-glucosidase